MLNRQDASGTYAGTMNADQAIPLDQALTLFTSNAASALGLAGQTSILTTGAWADFIILSKDIRGLSPEQIANMKVQETVWKGQTVFAL